MVCSWLFPFIITALLTGCFWGGGDKPAPPPQSAAPQPGEIIDLDKVIVAFAETLDDMDMAGIGKASDKELSEMAAIPKDILKESAITAKRLDPKDRDQFVRKFAERLNKVQPLKKTFGASFDQDGTLKGFGDDNRNGTKDGQEKELFRIFIDHKRKRLIVWDGKTYYRDFVFTDFLPASFTHGLLGEMLTGQIEKRVDSVKFGEIKLSPKDYHKKLSQPPPAPAK